MRRFGLMLVVAAFTAIALNVVQPPAGADAATSCIKMTKIRYDSAGADTGSNTSLNDEWVRLKNNCASSKNLASFKIRDAAGNTYTFGSFTLAVDARVKVHSGKGTNTASHRYWGRTTYVWGNTRDTGKLYDALGYLVQKCSYDSSAVNSYACPIGTYL